MATSKITITLPDDQLESVRALVASGQTPNVSAFVKHAVDIALSGAVAFDEMLDDALRRTGGPLTKKEKAWAAAIINWTPDTGGSTRKRKKQRERIHS